MPAIACNICGKINRLPTKKWKLILSDEPYVCSAKCVYDWITTNREWVPTGGILIVEKRPFRSNFEERFNQWLTINEWSGAYERWIFPVGNGSYTPDFFTANGFVETKGLWRLGQKKKFKAFRKQYSNIPILVVPWTIQSEF